MNANRIMTVLKSHKKELAETYSVQQIGLFGSYVRGEQNPKSDVDILVEFYNTPGLFGFIELKEKLGDLIGKTVDLVPKKALKTAIGKRILAEVKYA